MSDARNIRRALRAKYPSEFDDGARCGATLKYPGDREAGGYPKGFHQWLLEKRNSWFAGFNAGFARRQVSEASDD
jgi:hypothetical protein